ncbi:MAG TPA: nickel-type superoxide dismutase maturation protease [Pyrinomonadaceae bacterium]|jgi:nickel-type superoxide dismutase maturation protease
MIRPFGFYSDRMREAGWKDRLLVILGSRWAVRVSGNSMRPALEDDDVVLVERAREIGVGDIVIAAHPFKQSVTVLKRVIRIGEDSRFELRGDDPDESSDSRSFGAIPREHIRGKVVCRLRRF